MMTLLTLQPDEVSSSRKVKKQLLGLVQGGSQNIQRNTVE